MTLLKTLTPLLDFFADDTSLNIIVDDPMQTADQLNSDLAKIHCWADKWLVTINPGELGLSLALGNKTNQFILQF